MKILIEHNGGLGDAILDTAYLKKLKEVDPTGQIDLLTYYDNAELFHNASYLDTVYPAPKDYNVNFVHDDLTNKYDRHVYVLGMLSWAFFTKNKTLFEQRQEFYHITASSEDISIELEDQLPVDIFNDFPITALFSAPSEQDIKSGKHISKKLWETIFDTFPEITFVQIGTERYDLSFSKRDNLLDLKDKITIQQTLSAIPLSTFVIGCDNFLNHASKAFNKKGIFLFGPNDPKQYGWKQNINLYNKKHCSPCLIAHKEHKCCFEEGIDNISIEQIDIAIKELI